MHGQHVLAPVLCRLWVGARRHIGRLGGGGVHVGLLLFCGAVYAGMRTSGVAPTVGALLTAAWVLLGSSDFVTA